MAQLHGVSSSQVMPLLDGWLVTSTAPGQYQHPEQCLDGEQDWLATTVPGTIAETLQQQQHGKLAQSSDADAYDWWYRCTFAGPIIQSGERAVLTFGGLATCARIWLNGHLLLTTDNMFRSYEVDVTAHLQAQNELVIQFVALRALLAQKRPRPRWRTQLIQQQQLRWVRTTLLGRMPGWTPSISCVGPWRAVTLTIQRSIVVEHMSLRTHAYVSEERGQVHVDMRVRCLDRVWPTHAELVVDDIAYALTLVHDDQGFLRVSGEVSIPQIQLWWPHTHGAQPLYPATLVLSSAQMRIELECGPLAFRTVDLLDATGADFGLCINTIPVFCRGTNWTPLNITTLRGTEQEYRDALLMAQRAGVNMLRISGTMLYEEDIFYALCDELGILVWQDFMFANMDYPFSDPDFYANCQQECVQVVENLQAHPCLAVICGNSEVEQQAAMLGIAPEYWRADYFARELSTLCQQALEIPYWPSTPSGGTFPFQMNVGTSHYQGFGAYLRSFEDVRRSEVRFATECLAFAHVPEDKTLDLYLDTHERVGHHPTWKERVPRDGSASWDFDDVRDYYMREIFSVDPLKLRYNDVEQYLALSRVVSGEVSAAVFAEWRRQQSTCHGGLVWLHRDPWPGAGWGIVDALGYPKAVYYYLRRIWLAQTCFFSDEGLNGLWLHVVNDHGYAIQANVQIKLYRTSGAALAVVDHAITAPAHSVQALHVDALFPHFRDLTHAYRFGPVSYDLAVATLTLPYEHHPGSEAFYFPAGIAALHGFDPELEADLTMPEDGKYEVTVRCKHFAQNVKLHVEGFLPEDNYFHMQPGGERRIKLYPYGSMRKLRGNVTALHSHKEVSISINI